MPILQAFSRQVPPGSIFQGRLYRFNEGQSTGAGPILGRCDFPSVSRAARANFLTRCASVPQVEITTGGTFVSMVFATGVLARARVQIGNVPPVTDSPDTTGFPFFPPENVVATVVTDAPKLIHQVSLVDELLQLETTLHTPLTTGQTLFFVIFVWNAAGSWDFVWNTTGVAPTTVPEPIKTKARSVSVSLRKLVCLDDSDDLSDGEATFNFVVIDAIGTPQIKTVNWNPMATGTSHSVANVTTQVNPPNAAGAVRVRIDGVEDDSGSFPPDDDDSASTSLLAMGGHALFFPVGEKKEQVDNALVNLSSQPATGDDSFHFIGEVSYSVNYV